MSPPRGLLPGNESFPIVIPITCPLPGNESFPINTSSNVSLAHQCAHILIQTPKAKGHGFRGMGSSNAFGAFSPENCLGGISLRPALFSQFLLGRQGLMSYDEDE